jgi:predicted PurR-regulated permease PerM
MSRIDIQLRAFLRGQAMVCAFLGMFYAVGLMVCGVPFAIPLALTVGPAVVLTLLAHGVDWHLIGVVVTFVVAQVLEGNFLTPKIVGSQVGLGPVWVILAIMVFSSALGFVGLLLAVPIAAVLKVLVGEGVELYRSSSFFSGEESSSVS